MTYEIKVFEPNEKEMDHGSIMIVLTNENSGKKWAIEMPYSYISGHVSQLQYAIVQLELELEKAIKANQ
jgi:hypothetical protein